MSLYGNIKRVDSSVFQFDRIYSTRDEMDKAAQTDGVYIGRYVLVEYGERYFTGLENNELIERSSENISNNSDLLDKLVEGKDYYITSDTEPVSNKKYYVKDPETNKLTAAENLTEFDSSVSYYEFSLFGDNRKVDEEVYGNTFDSTVWLKIYSGNQEKYIMVAELNALIPQLTLKPIAPVQYTKETDPNKQEEVYTKDNEKIEEVRSYFVDPYFSEMQDTELEYTMYMPKPLSLNVSDDTIDYNVEGFNVVYSPKRVNNEETQTEISQSQVLIDQVKDSYIHWVPDNLPKTISEPTDVDSKTLYMNMPAFGNTIQDLYDLLYGVPDPNTRVRPFFSPEWTIANEEYKANHNQEELNAENDDLSWLANIPSIGSLLANNTTGLAGILSYLFSIKNPITGEVFYYLRTMWDGLFDEQSSEPNISGKPEVVTTSSETTVDGTYIDEEGQEQDRIVDYLGHYKINYDGWLLSPV